ncbi:hypothetical protein NAV31_01615 [Pseudomonas stutzeri]|nr:hypothetical protein [Stutzerimonas degradans]
MKYAVTFLALAWFTLILNICVGFQLGAEWLGRSGAIMVLFSIMAEYKLLTLRFLHLRESDSHKGGYGGGATGDTEPDQCQLLVEKIAHASAIVGTFIWGYGDKFI